MTADEAEKLVLTIGLLEVIYKGNSEKMASWLTTKSPHMGQVAPIDFFMKGQGSKILILAIGTAVDRIKV